jgi:hypothetical protein
MWMMISWSFAGGFLTGLAMVLKRGLLAWLFG